jgi:hypothetical protein
MTTEKIICAVCEKRESIPWQHAPAVPICLACLNRGRTARTAPSPITVSLSPSADEALVREGERRLACGEAGSLLDVARST